ncbi:hypothetical protein NB723_002035 [Xanthomonas sacchari]|nr:hypothetical protein [Xanthomonas sacchari]
MPHRRRATPRVALPTLQVRWADCHDRAGRCSGAPAARCRLRLSMQSFTGAVRRTQPMQGRTQPRRTGPCRWRHFFIALRNNLEKPAAGFVKKASLECGAKHSCVTYLCRFIAYACRRWQRSVRANGRGDRVTPVLWRRCGTIDPDLRVGTSQCRRGMSAQSHCTWCCRPAVRTVLLSQGVPVMSLDTARLSRSPRHVAHRRRRPHPRVSPLQRPRR